jgi:hypothetical protein
MHRARRMTLRFLGMTTAAMMSVGFVAGVATAQVAPRAWSSSVCTALTDWAGELEDLSGRLEPPENATRKQFKAALVDFLDGAVDASDTLIEDIEAAGYPEVEDGKAVAKVFKGGMTRSRAIFAKALRDAEKLPTTSAAEFEAKGRRIERALDRGSREVEGNFDAAKDRYDVPELNRAFNNEPACKDLG